MRFKMPPLQTRSWVTLERAAELTGANVSAIKAIVATGTMATKAVLIPGAECTLVDRAQILAYFRELTPAA